MGRSTMNVTTKFDGSMRSGLRKKVGIAGPIRVQRTSPLVGFDLKLFSATRTMLNEPVKFAVNLGNSLRCNCSPMRMARISTDSAQRQQK